MDRDTRALTGIRGVAALWVMVGHFSSGLYGGSWLHLASKAYLAVDLFFVLSGFVLALNHAVVFETAEPSDACFAFYRRRIARVYPLLLVVLVLTLVQQAFAGMALPSPIKLLTNFTMTQAWFVQGAIIPTTWSVSVEAFAYVAFPWIAAFVFRRSPAVALGVILGAGACLWWLTTLDPETTFGEVHRGGALDIYRGSIYPILRGVCGFAAGVCAYRVFRLPRVRAAAATRGLPEALLAVIVVLLWRTECDLVVAILFVPLIGALAMPGHLASRALRSRLAMLFGDLSYALYLSHFLVGTIVRDAFTGTMPYAFVLLACAVTAIAASAVLHVFVEKPCHAAFRRPVQITPPASALAPA